MRANWTDADTFFLHHLYDLQIKSMVNYIYYGERLKKMLFVSFWMEVIIASTASGSGLASLQLPDYVWRTLLAVAAVAAIIRPIYAPGKKIEIFSKQKHGYTTNYFAVKKLAFAISQCEAITAETRQRYGVIMDRHAQLSFDDEPTPRQREMQKAMKDANGNLPPQALWWPRQLLQPTSLEGAANIRSAAVTDIGSPQSLRLPEPQRRTG
jgi:hypothetical protein